jgi:triosephosphate isomerase
MKDIVIAGNWKSNKTIAEASEWVKQFMVHSSSFTYQKTNITGVIFAPFICLSPLHEQIIANHIPLSVGAQNVSKFDEGAYTGEVSARMIKEVADWVLIGHSERRSYFRETDDDLAKKVEKARCAGLNVMYCVPDDKVSIPESVTAVACEPVWAIGTGKTDTPENADTVISSIKEKTKSALVCYGGSITAKNARSFLTQRSIDGVLVGGASLDLTAFLEIIRTASTLI